VTNVRMPAVAGSFYSANSEELAATVDRMVDEAHVANRTEPLGAMIVPHAGYVYSGPVAATAYRRLLDQGRTVRTAVVLGPNHTLPLDTIALSGVDVWRTPLGEIPVDVELRAELVAAGTAVIADAPHMAEHAIEVQLPFLQRILADGWKLLPAVVGHVPYVWGGAFIDRCWGEEDLVVISSDLSHYLPYDEARRRDRVTVDAIVAGDPDAIHSDQACGASPVRSLLAAAATTAMSPEVLDLRNSGDTAGPRDRVVGYAAVTYHSALPSFSRL
jgi:AmmeMemoRadiSam system protein B